MTQYNDAEVFKDLMDLKAFLKKQTFKRLQENPVKKIFKAADGTFLVWIVKDDYDMPDPNNKK